MSVLNSRPFQVALTKGIVGLCHCYWTWAAWAFWHAFFGLGCSGQTFFCGASADPSPNSCEKDEIVRNVSLSFSDSPGFPGRMMRAVFIPATCAAVASTAF